MGEEAAVAANGAGAAISNRPHAVVVPYPLQGHVIPAVHLALRLAGRGFAVTFVNTESVHHQTARAIGGDIFAGVRAAAGSQDDRPPLDLRYEVASDGFPLGFDRSLNHDQFMEGVLHVLPAHVEELLRRVVVDPPTTCLVVDTFFVWPATLARKLAVPYVSALIFSLYYHMDLLTEHGHFNCKEPRKDTITYIPGVPAIEPTELMSYLQETDTTSVAHRIIFNTVEELEPSTIAAGVPTTCSATPWRSWSRPPSPRCAPRSPSTPWAPSSRRASPAAPWPRPCGPSPTAPGGWPRSHRAPCSTSPSAATRTSPGRSSARSPPGCWQAARGSCGCCGPTW